MTARLTIDARVPRLADAFDDPGERGLLERQLPDYLRAQRWFGGRTRRLVATRLERWVPLDSLDVCLAVVAAADSDGLTTEHLLFLVAAEPDADAPGARRAVDDALARPEARVALLRLALDGGRLAGLGVDLVCERVPSGRGAPPPADYGPGRLAGVEQSNSSVIYGDACILKLYRRLARGRNPDVELGRYLTTEARFAATPPLVASARLDGPGGYDADALLVQGFVANEGDGWLWALAAARRAFNSASPDELPNWLAAERETLAGAASLGQTTAQLHAALAGATGEALRPERATARDVEEWAGALRMEAGETALALERSGLADPALAAALARTRGFAVPSPPDPGLKMRVHGDYHLGQVLRTAQTAGGFVVLDFEGEPARPLSERRARQHPLVDVAGMLRSWGYAAHIAAREGEGRAVKGAGRGSTGPDLRPATWEAAVRAAFLDAYWAEADAARPPFLPADRASRERLLALFELRKALYEVRYELNNRPAWVDIPAGAVLRMASDE